MGAWNETEKAYTRPLHYYLSSLTDVVTAAALLSGGDGQCHAWAEMFKECLLVNNVSNLKKTNVSPPVDYIEFGVKNISDDGSPTYPNDYPWQYHRDDLDISPVGIPGQNTDPPHSKIFVQHWIVHRTGAPIFYDPSYGVTTTGASAYTDSIEVWSRIYGGHLAYRYRSGDPSILEFVDLDW